MKVWKINVFNFGVYNNNFVRKYYGGRIVFVSFIIRKFLILEFGNLIVVRI